jgi:uncharacterized protein (TIGR03435 family)
MLTMTLSDVLGRLVLDKTALTDHYDYVLAWTPDVAVTGSQGRDAVQPVDSPGPTIFTALQEQPGLKPESTKGPVDTIVIDQCRPAFTELDLAEFLRGEEVLQFFRRGLRRVGTVNRIALNALGE